MILFKGKFIRNLQIKLSMIRYFENHFIYRQDIQTLCLIKRVSHEWGETEIEIGDSKEINLISLIEMEIAPILNSLASHSRLYKPTNIFYKPNIICTVLWSRAGRRTERHWERLEEMWDVSPRISILDTQTNVNTISPPQTPLVSWQKEIS